MGMSSASHLFHQYIKMKSVQITTMDDKISVSCKCTQLLSSALVTHSHVLRLASDYGLLYSRP